MWRWGERALWAGLVGGIVLALLLAWRAPQFLFLLPAAVVGLAAATVLFRHPTLNLAVVLGGFVFAVSSDPGIQVTEAVYGLYYYAFILYWYGLRLAARQPIARTSLDRAVALFIIGGVVLGIGSGLVFGAPLSLLRADLTAFLMLALYFPVKELCRTHRYGPEIVIGAMLGIGLYLSFNTFVLFRGVLRSATVAWQVADVRFGAVEALIFISCIIALALVLVARRRSHQVGLIGIFLFVLAALVLTRGRTYWVALVLAVGLFLLLLRGSQRARFIALSVAGLGGLAGVTFLFFGQAADLLFSGTLNRITMISSQDISMQARFFEWRAVWAYISANPVLGYGFGTTYSHFDILSNATYVKGFIHNGYLAVWYKLGLFGLIVLLFVWGRSLLSAYRLHRSDDVSRRHRAFALTAFISLTTLALTANTAIFFLVMDQIFAFALLVGLVSGLAQRADAPAPRRAPSA